ncbi:MAG: hypothetical protein ACRDRP_07245 [Pseudonocardiaceae bacterium]
MDRQELIRAALGVGAATVAGPVACADLITPNQVAEVRNAAQAFGGWQSFYGGAAFHAGRTGRALRDVAVHGHFVTEARFGEPHTRFGEPHKGLAELTHRIGSAVVVS